MGYKETKQRSFRRGWGTGLVVIPHPQQWLSFHSFCFLWWEALAERAIPRNQCLSECLSQCVTPRCQQAAGRRGAVTTFDLTASRKLHFYQLLVAGSKNLCFIFGVIFFSLSLSSLSSPKCHVDL